MCVKAIDYHFRKRFIKEKGEDWDTEITVRNYWKTFKGEK